jgi:DNA-binding helix-hairpin-helix protein with protein kinase domain
MASPAQSARLSAHVVWPGGKAEPVRLKDIGKSGGAGEVFAVEGRTELVAKIYHATIGEAQLAQYARKIRWMIRNRPELPEIPAGHHGVVQLAWPVGLVMQGSRFAGFMMEKVDFDRTLELDYLLTRRQAAAEGFNADFGKLVTVCYNLAALVNCLHGRKIAVVDLKPINLKVYKSELYVSILDCDGFHIYSDGFVSEAPQVTPEYLAPEFHGRAVTGPETQDGFALATIIFRLLNFGIHPYAGIAASRTPYPPELAGRIQLGLYPYGRRSSAHVRATPASVHECFPESIRELFDRSFARGGGARASAAEWADVLGGFASRSGGRMAPCPRGHLQFADKPCPTCLREGVIRGYVERQKRFGPRLKAAPVRAAIFVRKSLRGTHSSPFQAALAQAQFNSVQLATVNISIRNVISIEIVWALGLAITYWWLK